MKKKLVIMGALITMLLSSCHKDAIVMTTLDDTEAVAFSAASITTLTRVSGSSWNQGDAIGITMLLSEDESIAYDNYKYVASDDGETTPFYPDAESETIYFTEDDSEVDFKAYYPYQESLSYKTGETTFDISVQDGTIEGQEMADLLISNNLTSQTDGEQVFIFSHALCKLQINVSNYSDISAFDNLNNLTATIQTSNTKYDISSNTVTSSNSTKTYEMYKTTTDDNNVVFTAIILPGEVSNEIYFENDEHSFSTTLSIEKAIAGTQYNYSAVVGDLRLTFIELSNNGISSWNNADESASTRDIEIVDGVYQIYTAAGLRYFASMVNSGSTDLNALLMNDIDLEGSENNQWTPMGTLSSSLESIPYIGIFDGGGFEVSGLYINQPESGAQALFGCVGSSGVIKNLGVNGTVTGYTYVGGIVGYSTNSEDYVLIDCYNKATVSGVTYVGGVIGYANGSISGCYNSGNVSGTSNCIGGVVATATDPIHNCYNTGNVSGPMKIGGVAAESVKEIYDCYNTGEVSALSSMAGGVCANVIWGISNCYNSGKVTCGGYYAGGVAAYATGSVYGSEFGNEFSDRVTNCYNTGEVSAGKTDYGHDSDGNSTYISFAGGIIGQSTIPVINCYNNGKISGEGRNVGGILGYSHVDIINCYNDEDGIVIGEDDYVGGIAGYSSSTNVVNCYNNATITGKSDYVGGISGLGIGINSCYNSANVIGAGDNTGGIAGRLEYSVTSCYYNSTNYSGAGVGTGTDDTKALTDSEMRSGIAATYLNNAAYVYNSSYPIYEACAWSEVTNDYPILDWDNAPVYTKLDYDISYNASTLSYLIYTANGLRLFSDLVNGSEQSVDNAILEGSDTRFPFGTVCNSINGVLMDDVDLAGEEWTPIGGTTNKFEGTFTGGDYSVTGLYISASNVTTNDNGLFGYVNNATITNLKVGGSVATSGVQHTAIIAGSATYSQIISCETLSGSTVVGSNDCTAGIVGYTVASSFEECTNRAVVNGAYYVGGVTGYISPYNSESTFVSCVNESDISGSNNVGGIVGSIRYVATNLAHSITNCSNSGKITSTDKYAGGIAGWFANGTITSCENTNSISSSQYSGGIAGYLNWSSSAITTTQISGSTNRGNILSGQYSGGIIGTNNGGYVSGCENFGSVESTGSYAGGITSQQFGSSGLIGTIINCANREDAKVTATSQYVGGLVGANTSGAIYNSYNKSSSTISGSDYVGGMVGINEQQDSNGINATLQIGYSSSDISGSSNVGLIAGCNSNSSISYCYYGSDKYTSYDAVGSDLGTTTNVIGFWTSFMEDLGFVGVLNDRAYFYNESSPSTTAYAWADTSNSCPDFDKNSTPTYTSTYDCTKYGSGTEDDPYIILIGAQIRDIATQVNSGTSYSGEYFKLYFDIDLDNVNHTAIGTYSSSDSYNAFSGTFDGDEHIISGLYINNDSNSYQGLFGCTYGATIKNLGVSGSVTGYESLAGIVGRCLASTIYNCYNTASVSGSWNNVGGIAGYINNGTIISECYNTGSMYGYNRVGGIAGANYSSTVKYCYSYGTIGTRLSNATAKGGIVGENTSGTYSYCYYDSDVATSVSGAINNGSGGGLSTEMMKGDAETSGTLLNYFINGGSTCWSSDTENINNGYPVLTWQMKE